MKTSLLRSSTSKTLLARLIDAPDLVQAVRALPPPAFSTLIRQIGVEDAGEVVALATTEQLVAAFDEDLFANPRAGERETFDSARFVVWLEVLLEAGDDVAAARIAELSEDFVIQALSAIVLVLDHDALMARMSEGGDDVEAADKAIESCLSEEIDGYLLISRDHDGWDAALALILALDRDHRSFLVRILDRCADIASAYVDDLEELTNLLSAADALAEDVEAEREDRRSKQGYVEPRAARNFLTLAKTPLATDTAATKRDPVTRAYFREVEPTATRAIRKAPVSSKTTRLLETIGSAVSNVPRGLLGSAEAPASIDQDNPIVVAMRMLGENDMKAFGERMEEFAYLVNVLVAGAQKDDGRFELAEAAEAVLATVALGAELEVHEKQGTKKRATPEELFDVLRVCHSDVLFRKASSTLASGKMKAGSRGFVCSHEELDAVVGRLYRPKKKAGT
ncbi:MAG: hypothetical protein IPM54_09275 [Polyangiaceae bacterium]|nr:hypothetical protein [Polyangiaceae bacterium]